MSFERENRYLVLKIKDIQKYLGVNDVAKLWFIANRIDECRDTDGKSQLDCVVVEKDWPEYEPTWKAIEERVNNEKQKDI